MQVALTSASAARQNVTTRARARGHASDIRIVGVENGNPAPRQIFDEPALLLCRPLQGAKTFVVIAADIGHHPNLRPQNSRLNPDPPRVFSGDLLDAEAGTK